MDALMLKLVRVLIRGFSALVFQGPLQYKFSDEFQGGNSV